MSEQNTKGSINIVYACRKISRVDPLECSMDLSTSMYESKLCNCTTGLLLFPQYDLETIKSFQDVCKITTWEF